MPDLGEMSDVAEAVNFSHCRVGPIRPLKFSELQQLLCVAKLEQVADDRCTLAVERGPSIGRGILAEREERFE